ncbi:MAG: tRNA pseudouridine(55) synthase TruB [Ruminococcus sp.]
MNGVIIINKPENFTSFDVVAVVRRLTGQRKIGHTGTLDPNATGVLPILLGNATKAQDIVPNHDKAYTAKFRLGITTDTLDIWGTVLSECGRTETRADILSVLDNFRGEIEQLPPMYSAVKVNGQRLYDLARQGREVERKPRRVTVYSLELVDFDEKTQSGTLGISCSRGTYIRTVIDDMGRLLGTGAVMTALCRTSACGYTLDDSITLENARKSAENGELAEHIMQTESLFAGYRKITVSDAQAKRFSNGGALDMARTALARANAESGEIIRVSDRQGKFLGLGTADSESGQLKIYKLFLTT